ncbi:NAD-dependent succinate-semialdehyde dehydrogenase [Ornithinibacillus sp. 4-3]|uniref:Aldehyde dehydrogenase n=1 Tax=Ornithinibacillus sp. 4-3 TaxID=3231488 RepID=A0AB39HTI3_9BACI
MLYINGEWIKTEDKMDVFNPATGELIESVSTGGKEYAKQAIQDAKEAFKTWKKLTAKERGSYLAKAAEIMKSKADQLAETITKENGKPLPDAKGEVASGIEHLEWYAEEAKRVYGDTVPASSPDRQLLVIKQPIGVCGAITPWNFPLSMITRKIAPAIAAGCTVVLKPAPDTPLSAIHVFECFHEAGLPKGVINLVIGPAEEIGHELTSSSDVRKISFTGSTMVGKKLLKDSADTVKKVSMELGGHAPYIVFDDADLDLAVDGILASKFKNAGQTCISTNRIYVHENVADEFSEKLAAKVSKLSVGNGIEDNVDVGPVITQAAISKVKNHVEDAVKNNGKVLTGGKVHAKSEAGGNFFEPTVIANANESMLIASEETFGPVAPIFTFKDEEEIVEKANHPTYGLAAYCFTSNLGRSMRMMQELEFGIVGINDTSPGGVQAPFGGVKESGIGKEGGQYGIREYLEEKAVSIRLV